MSQDSYDNLSEAENSEAVPTYTVVFKVIGCTKETQYQNILEQCRDLLEDGHSVCVKLSPEPDNVFDQIMCLTPKQLLSFVKWNQRMVQDAALIANDITNVWHHRLVPRVLGY